MIIPFRGCLNYFALWHIPNCVIVRHSGPDLVFIRNSNQSYSHFVLHYQRMKSRDVAIIPSSCMMLILLCRHFLFQVYIHYYHIMLHYTTDCTNLTYMECLSAEQMLKFYVKVLHTYYCPLWAI